MARTKQEVREFLESQVGQKVNAKAGKNNGQCVSLIKALLEFVGVADPYAARGNARDCGDTLLRQGIANNGGGWLAILVNRDMGLIDGIRYGHIWVDLAGEANFEQNGARALHTTKNTRPHTQGQQVINLDHLLAPDPAPAPTPTPVVEGMPAGDFHTVREGDTYWALEETWGLNHGYLQTLNPDKPARELVVGSSIRIRGAVASSPAPEQPRGFAVGDVVVPTSLVDYDGTSLTQWDDNYTISEISGDRAVLVARDTVWAAMNTANIRHQ